MILYILKKILPPVVIAGLLYTGVVALIEWLNFNPFLGGVIFGAVLLLILTATHVYGEIQWRALNRKLKSMMPRESFVSRETGEEASQ